MRISAIPVGGMSYGTLSLDCVDETNASDKLMTLIFWRGEIITRISHRFGEAGEGVILQNSSQLLCESTARVARIPRT